MAARPSAYVLDSFAIVAYLEGEAGAARVMALLAGAEQARHTIHVSLINVGEVLYITERERGLVQAQHALAAIEQLPIRIAPVTRATVLAAAHVKARHPVSYADAFAVATAIESSAVIVTGDPEFKAIERSRLAAIEWLTR